MTLNRNYLNKIKQESIRPRWYLRIDFLDDFTDPVYFLSNKDMASMFAGKDFLSSTLVSAPIESQELGRIPTVGKMTLEFNDVVGSVHDKFREKLTVENKGLSFKRAQLFEGMDGLILNDYEVIGTASTGNVVYDKGVYRITGEDVSIFSKKAKIFTPQSTKLISSIIADKVGDDISFSTQTGNVTSTITDLRGYKIGAKFLVSGSSLNDFFFTVTAISKNSITVLEPNIFDESAVDGKNITLSQATIEVLDTSQLPMKWQGQTYSDGKNTTTGYCRIGNNKIAFTSSSNGILNNCRQGVLNSRQEESIVDSSVVGTDNLTDVDSHKYYEMPYVEFLYGILTGVIYSDISGSFMPKEDSMFLDGEYVRGTDFTNIGSDIWDLLNPSNSKVCYFDGLKSQSVKKFIEKEILPVISCNLKVYNNGEYGIERDIFPTKNSPPTFVLNKQNSFDWSGLSYDSAEAVTKIIIHWHWSDLESRYKKTNTFHLGGSLSISNTGKTREIGLKGLNNKRHTNQTIANIADDIAQRVGYPPVKISCSVLPHEIENIEVGAIGLCSCDYVKDFSGDTDTLNRSMKVIKFTRDLKSGEFRVTFEGSSGLTDALIEVSTPSVLNPSNYLNFGVTNIDIAGLPTYYTSGGVGHLGSTLLAGGQTVGEKAFYHVGDLVFDQNTTQTLTGNVVVMCDGFFESKGFVNGAGGGLAGGIGSTKIKTGLSIANAGVRTGVGSTLSAGGFSDAAQQTVTLPDGGQVLISEATAISGSGVTGKSFPYALSLTINYRDGDIYGIKDFDLQGVGSASGAPIAWLNGLVNDGANGASGGASFVLFSKGSSFSGSSSINLSGGNGSSGTKIDVGMFKVTTGHSGGGASGSLVIVNDGISSSPADMTGRAIMLTGKTKSGGVAIKSLSPNKSPPAGDYYKSKYNGNEAVAEKDVKEEFFRVKYARTEGQLNEEPNVALPRPMSNLSFFSDDTTFEKNNDGTILYYAKLTWTASTDPLVDSTEVQFKAYASDAVWRSYSGILNRSDDEAWIPNLVSGKKYYFRVRSRNLNNMAGNWNYISGTVAEKSGGPQAPALPAIILGRSSGLELKLTSAGIPTDRDLHAIEIWSSTINSLLSSTDKFTVGIKPNKDFTFRYDVTAGETRYHWWRFMDRSLNLSAFYPYDTAGQAQTAAFATGADVKYSNGVLLDDLQPIEVGATNAGSAIESLSAGILPNWNLNIENKVGLPAGIFRVESTVTNDLIAFADSNKDAIVIYGSAGVGVAYGFPAIAIDDNQKYSVTIRHKTDNATPPTTGLYLRLNETDVTLNKGKTHLGSIDPNYQSYSPWVQLRSSFKDLLANGPMPNTTYIEDTYIYTPTTGTLFASFSMYNWTDSDANYIVDSVQISIISKDADQIPESTTRKFASESGATINAPRIAIKKNILNWNTANNGECYIHGFSNGVAADVNGKVLYNGNEIEVPREYTSLGTSASLMTGAVGNGYILFNTALTDRFLVSNVYIQTVFVKKTGGKWFYDTNSYGWEEFIPISTDIIIGTLVCKAVDIVDSAEIWPQGMSLDVVGEAGSDATQTALETGIDALFNKASFSGVDAFNTNKNYMHWNCQTGIDGYPTSIGAGMSITQQPYSIEVLSPNLTLAGEEAVIYNISRRISGGSFLEDRGLEFTFQMQTASSPMAETFMVAGSRRIFSGREYFGFLVVGTDLYAVSGKSSSETRKIIQSINVGTTYKITALKDYANLKIDFYVDEIYSNVTITSNLPVTSGGPDSRSDFEISVKQITNGDFETKLRVYDVKVVTNE